MNVKKYEQRFEYSLWEIPQFRTAPNTEQRRKIEKSRCNQDDVLEDKEAIIERIGCIEYLKYARFLEKKEMFENR